MSKKEKIRIYQLKSIPKSDRGMLQSINDLLGFLSPKNYSINRERLEKLLENKFLEIHLLEAEGKIIGMGSLHYTETIVKKSAWIEDVVVHPDYRKKGLGKKIMKHVISRARKRKVKHVDLTSRNDRKKAHEFYKKLDFEKRDTSVYRKKIARK